MLLTMKSSVLSVWTLRQITSTFTQPFGGAVNVEAKDIGKLLRVIPLRVGMKEFDIRNQVAFCLNASFYNHPAVSIDDVKMREDMRSLAIGKYGLPR